MPSKGCDSEQDLRAVNQGVSSYRETAGSEGVRVDALLFPPPSKMNMLTHTPNHTPKLSSVHLTSFSHTDRFLSLPLALWILPAAFLPPLQNSYQSVLPVLLMGSISSVSP